MKLLQKYRSSVQVVYSSTVYLYMKCWGCHYGFSLPLKKITRLRRRRILNSKQYWKIQTNKLGLSCAKLRISYFSVGVGWWVVGELKIKTNLSLARASLLGLSLAMSFKKLGFNEKRTNKITNYQ